MAIIRKCESCGIKFRTHTSITICKKCQKIRFHIRNVMPKHIPASQTMKFIDIWKSKYGDIS
jgi:hypothetical protein